MVNVVVATDLNLRPLDLQSVERFARQWGESNPVGPVEQLTIRDDVRPDGSFRRNLAIEHASCYVGFVRIEAIRMMPGLLCIVSALWIVPARRREGFAASTLAKVDDIARRSGCGALEALIDTENRAAQSLFGNSGYVFAGWHSVTLMRLQKGVPE